jgi:hypothetical protein
MVVSFIRYKKKDSFSLFVLIFSLLILVVNLIISGLLAVVLSICAVGIIILMAIANKKEDSLFENKVDLLIFNSKTEFSLGVTTIALVACAIYYL